MSAQRLAFEAEVRKPSPDWTKAVDNLNALAMFEMLPTLAGLTAAVRKEVGSKAWRILSLDRGWKGSYDRIDFAIEVVTDRKFSPADTRAPTAQIEDATRFLIALLRPAKSQAAHVGFSSADDAAIAALLEIMGTTNAVGLEFSGSIYAQAGSFRFTAPVRGDPTGSDANVPVPSGTKLVGMYHTHPANNSNAENFSPQDMIICRGNPALKIPPRVSYLGTPSGKIKKLTPPELLSGEERKKFPLLGKQVVLR